MPKAWARIIVCGVSLLPSAVASAQKSVPIRELGPVEAASTEPFKNVFSVRALPDGKLLVNDGTRRQVVVLDKQLTLSHVVLDTTEAAVHKYGTRAAPIIPYLGDSTLFVDLQGASLLVIDPAGKVARVTAAPNPRDLSALYGSESTTDPFGNLVYLQPIYSSSSSTPVPGSQPSPRRVVDSFPIVRANFETREVQSVGKVKIPSSTFTRSVQEGMKMRVTKTINPLTTVDVWAVLTDGTVAFVRGHDYHIEFVRPSGETFATPKLPFDWKPLSESDKLALIDSSRKAEEKALEVAKANTRERQLVSQQEAARGIIPSMDPTFEYVPLKEIADYYPAVRAGAAKPDADNNLWILPTSSAQSKAGELVYDVVNNRGALTHRVRVPANRSIAGFGKGGVVYLMYRDDASIWHIERTKTIN